MNRTFLVILAGVLVLPAIILGVSAGYETHSFPSDCAGRQPWLLAAVSRYVAAEGAAGAHDRFASSTTSDQIQGVADSYATAEAQQKASKPPAPEVQTNDLLTQYYTMMNANWASWATNRYSVVYEDTQVQALFTALQQAMKTAQSHCS